MTTTAVLAFAALVWFVLASLYLRQAVWLLLLWVPVQGWIQLNVFSDSNLAVLLYELQMVGLYLVFGLRALKSPDRFGPPSLTRFAIPFAAWALLVIVPYSVFETGLVLTLVGLRTFLLPIPLIWIGYRAFQTRRELEIVTALIALQLVLIGAVTVSQFAGLTSMSGAVTRVPTGYAIAYYVVRPPGTFAASGHLGNYVLFSIPFALGLLGLRTAFWKRVCFGVGLAGATAALVANTQRAAIVLLVLTVPLMVALARRGRAMMMATVGVCVMAAAGWLVADVAGEAFQLRVQSISYDLQRTLVTNPMENLSDALRTPVLGSGLGIASPGVGRLEPGSSLNAFAPRPESIKWGEQFVVALVYETGVPGLLLFYVFLAAIMYYSFQALRACRGTDMALLAAAIFTSQLAIILYSWAYSPLRTLPGRVLFWFWAGVLLSLPRLAAAKSVVQESISARRTPTDRMAALRAQRQTQPHVAGARRRAG